MEKKEQKKRIAANTLYNMGGLIFMNGVLQLIITPLLNRYMGAKQLGELLYITGLVAIICPSVGQALNTSRLVVRRSHEVTNGDYDWILLLFGILGSGVALFMSRDSISGIPVGIGVFALFLLTVFRYYGDVEYRLNLNYQRYFIYYLLIGIGYLAGFVIYRITDQWLWIYLVGEVAALCYVAVTGSVFHKFFQRSGHFFVALERGFFLTLSYLIAPINTIVISYLTKRRELLNRSQFGKAVLAGGGVAGVFFLGCQVGTPLFVWLFYHDLFPSIKGLVTVVNLAQVLGLFSAFLFILVLTFTDEKWQLWIQLAHFVILLTASVLAAKNYGMIGFAWACLGANTLRVVAVIALGIWKAKPAKKEGE